MSAPTPSVSVVIPSRRGGSSLERLVRSLALTSGHLQVVVVDNGLPEGARSLRHTEAEVVPMGTNLGFGAAVNRGAVAADGDVLVVLNDDVDPEPGFLDELVAPVGAGAEMAAGVLLQAHAPGVIETAGIVIDRTLSASDYLHGEPVSRLDEPLPPPLGPCGGAAAFSRTAFLDAGGFDEGFFAYCEDVDLAIRLRSAGATCGLAPRAQALHEGSATLGYGSLAKANAVGLSRGYLLRKYGVLRRPRSAAAAIAAETVAVLLLARRHHSLQPARARVRGWRSCGTTVPVPREADVTVGFFSGLRRRYARARMPAATAAR